MTLRGEPHPLSVRRKRLHVRARLRGTLEICVLLEKYLKVSAPVREQEIAQLEALLDETDQDIADWLAAAAPWPDQHKPVLAAISQALNLPFRHQRD